MAPVQYLQWFSQMYHVNLTLTNNCERKVLWRFLQSRTGRLQK